jgi:molecular chaperone DnaJ
MVVKDYYKTLGVSPAASMQDIKKAFRRLALQFHPDKNHDNSHATARFREIQEAYEVLSDPLQRETYNYKRWYRRSLGKEYEQPILTPSGILAACNRLANYVSNTNIFQVDYDALSYHIRQLLSDTNIGILNQFNDTSINGQVIHAVIRSATPLPFKYIEPVTKLLLLVAGPDAEQAATIHLFENGQRRKNKWNKYRAVAVLAVTLLLCWLIYSVSR